MRMLEAGSKLRGFTVRSTEELPEIDGQAIVMDHVASGTKLLFLQNDDENKAFSITFKTPPADDTGVFHILEHSVLCGSEKFAVKEPFVNLLRTSMQTFLNAITFADKTMYPVASTNEQDLLNLMDVYLDAVLHPMLYSDKHIFEQEAWHYELVDSAALSDGESAEGEQRQLVYNGVVFNEMKGALADPESVLYHAINNALFPDTCYAFESGGHPRAIPQLTYEVYCDTHARHYRLDNSYIVLYGDLNIDRVLAFLDENYLGDAARGVAVPGTNYEDDAIISTGDRIVGPPNPVGEIKPVISFDNVVEMATSPENACVGIGYVLGESRDFERVLATEVLLDALMSGNESPLKRAILDAQLGGDCTAHLIDAQEQPVVLLELKNAKPGVAQQFRELVEGEVRKLVEQGIPRDVLETRHAALVDLQVNPAAGAGEEEAELAAKQASLTEEDFAAIDAEVEALRVRQQAPDSPEALASLPQLHVSDIGPAKPYPALEVHTETPVPCLYHNLPSRHINYLNWYFDLGHLNWDDIPYVALLAMLLGNLDTQQHTAAELDVHVRQHLGRLYFFPDMHTDHNDREKVLLKLVVSASALAEESTNLAAIPAEVWARTRFDDMNRIRDILVQKRIALEDSFINEGHVRAMSRASSYLFKSSLLMEYVAGVDFYYFLKDLIENFDESFDALRGRLENLQERIFTADNCIASFTGSPEELAAFWAAWAEQEPVFSAQPGSGTEAGTQLGQLTKGEAITFVPEPEDKREAFITPADVCFVVRAADFGAREFDGVWNVLGRVLGFDYLWNEVRVKGGAYGCGFRCGNNGHGRFYSYRDPQLDATLARFDETGKWLSAFEPDVDEMEGYIVSSVATHDAPQKARLIARIQDSTYFASRPEGWREHVRETMLATTPGQLRALASIFEEASSSGTVCVFGAPDIINAAQEKLNTVPLLEA